MTELTAPIIEVQMLIRKPINLVFQAIINPEITTKFWFTKSSGKLEPNANLTWEWEMYGVSTEVFVNQVIQDEKIVIEWGSQKTTVEFLFQCVDENSTYVIIKNYGFKMEEKELLNAVMDYTGGFTTVIDGMKAYLEHGIHLNLIADKFPENLV